MRNMKKPRLSEERIREIIEKLLGEIEEEDIGISLLTTHYSSQAELKFFKEDDRRRVTEILEQLAEDSRRHKKVLKSIVGHMEKRIGPA